MNRYLAAIAATVSAALLLSVPPAQAEAGSPPVRAVFGGAVTPATPILPIGSKLPAQLPGLTALAKDGQPPRPADLDRAQQEATTQPALSPTGTAGATADAFVTVKWCRDNYGTSNGATQIDRFNWCAIRPTVIYYLDTSGAITGTTTFRMTTAGQALRTGSRTVSFTTGSDLFVDVGSTRPAASTRLELTYTTSGYSDWDGSNPACSVTGNSPTTVASWKTAATAVFSITSAKDDGYSGDKMSRCGVAQWGTSDLNPVWYQLQRTDVRQDSATYLGVAGGSIFLGQVPVFRAYSRTSATHGAVARHIWDAQNMPVNTYPSSPNKSVPGSIASGKPLHRAADVVWDLPSYERVRANETERKKACLVLAPGGTPVGEECDEYPFRTTWEGAGAGDNNFSVRYVTKSHNTEAGNLLNAFYSGQRILGREAFYTEIND